MMTGFFFAILISILLALLLVGAAGWRHPRHDSALGATLFLFLLLLFVSWAGGLWIAPYGPTVWGGAWLPTVGIAVITALIVLAIGSSTSPPPRTPESVEEAAIEEEEAVAATSFAVVFGVFFWLLLGATLVAVIVRMFTTA